MTADQPWSSACPIELDPDWDVELRARWVAVFSNSSRVLQLGSQNSATSSLHSKLEHFSIAYSKIESGFIDQRHEEISFACLLRKRSPHLSLMTLKTFRKRACLAVFAFFLVRSLASLKLGFAFVAIDEDSSWHDLMAKCQTRASSLDKEYQRPKLANLFVVLWFSSPMLCCWQWGGGGGGDCSGDSMVKEMASLPLFLLSPRSIVSYAQHDGLLSLTHRSPAGKFTSLFFYYPANVGRRLLYTYSTCSIGIS